jgi:hypothetical protein
MTLTPWDILWIQTAIERYEETYPDRPSPSPAEALAWHANQSGIESRPAERSQTTACARDLRSKVSATIRVWWHKIVLPIVARIRPL